MYLLPRSPSCLMHGHGSGSSRARRKPMLWSAMVSAPWLCSACGRGSATAYPSPTGTLSGSWVGRSMSPSTPTRPTRWRFNGHFRPWLSTSRRGALVVRVVHLPDKANGSKQGVDDFLVTGGTIEGLLELSEEHSRLGAVNPEWPRMPEEAYCGLAGSIVRKIEPNTESDPAGLLLLIISAMGNSFGRGAYFEVENDVHYCKTNVILVGESSKA